MQISLERFLRTGVLGGVCSGTSKQQILEKWGLPEDEQTRAPDATVMIYRGVCFWFHHDTLDVFGIYPDLMTWELPESFSWEEFTPTATTTHQDLLSLMEAKGIQYESFSCAVGQLSRTESGVWIISDTEVLSLVYPDIATEPGLQLQIDIAAGSSASARFG